MSVLLILSIYFGGMVLLLAAGHLIGTFLHLDRSSADGNEIPHELIRHEEPEARAAARRSSHGA